VALVLGLSACSSDDKPSEGSDKSGELKPFRVTTADNWTTALLFRATESQGFFKKQGLDVTWVPLNSGPDAIAALVGGSTDITSPSAPAALNAMATGDIDMTIVAATHGGDYQLVISKTWAADHDLTEDSTPADVVKSLDGATMGATSTTGVVNALTRTVLNGYGLKPDEDVKIEYLNDPPSLLANFESGRVDGFVYPSDMSATAQDRDGALLVPLSKMTDIPELASNLAEVMAVKKSALEKDPAVYTSYLTALWQGWGWMKDNKEETREVLKGFYPDMLDASFDAAYQYVVDGGLNITESSFDTALQIVNSVAESPVELAYAGAVDEGPQKQAVDQLGIAGDIPSGD
jgi:ABC-type nitrate/sulfonate/bicarbonate transport system substrate-binding protein